MSSEKCTISLKKCNPIFFGFLLDAGLVACAGRVEPLQGCDRICYGAPFLSLHIHPLVQAKNFTYSDAYSLLTTRYSSWLDSPDGSRPALRGSSITLRHTMHSKLPLGEWSVLRKDLYLTAHNSHGRYFRLQWDLNSQPQQVRGHGPTPWPHDLWNRQKLKQTFHNLQTFLLGVGWGGGGGRWCWGSFPVCAFVFECVCASFCGNRECMKIMVAAAAVRHIKTEALPTTATVLR
jgi:hypothetical protein